MLCFNDTSLNKLKFCNSTEAVIIFFTIVMRTSFDRHKNVPFSWPQITDEVEEVTIGMLHAFVVRAESHSASSWGF